MTEVIRYTRSIILQDIKILSDVMVNFWTVVMPIVWTRDPEKEGANPTHKSLNYVATCVVVLEKVRILVISVLA